MSICEYCKADYESKRADSRFCSDKCRKALSRTNSPDRANPDNIPEKNALQDCAGATIPSLPDTKHPLNYGHDDCQCLHCKQDDGKHIINHGPYKPDSELDDNEINRVSLPGDMDYAGVCQESGKGAWGC